MTQPRCSIIVPIFRRPSLTRQCLNTLFRRAPRAVAIEVIAVDDASGDITPRLLADFGERVRVVRHDVNQGFAAACNSGAAAATGDYLVFLHQDTVPTAGWLEALVACAEREPDAVAVGARLLYPDETVQHAGLVIGHDGLPHPLYAGFPEDHPAVNRTRRLLAVSGACLLVPRADFEAVGGFDAELGNHLADVDLCLRLGERGGVYYCPESVLVHLAASAAEAVRPIGADDLSRPHPPASTQPPPYPPSGGPTHSAERPSAGPQRGRAGEGSGGAGDPSATPRTPTADGAPGEARCAPLPAPAPEEPAPTEGRWAASLARFRARWADRLQPDDLVRYAEDGLLAVDYGDGYPLHLRVAPELALIANGEGRARRLESLLSARSRQVFTLLKENIHLSYLHLKLPDLPASTTAEVTDADGAAASGSGAAGRAAAPPPSAGTRGPGGASPMLLLLHERLRSFLASGRRLALPAADQPLVSIVIPVHDQAHYLLMCLESLRDNPQTTPFEVIVVDDASGDEMQAFLDRLDGVVIHRNEANQGFVGACNTGAARARGDWVLFLNSDTLLTPGWLDALVRAAEPAPSSAAEGAAVDARPVGAVGAKLVHPDGRLQEAGSIIWQSGETSGYGRGEDPAAPQYNYVREVDYISGAALMVRRDLFRQLGAFDERYAPAYYEDADLCLAIREAGYRVLYQPESLVYHVEFGSSGSARAIALQLRNRSAFVAKWRAVLERQWPLLPGNGLLARDSRRGRRLLVIDDRIPDPTLGLGFPRTWALLKGLVDLGYVVTYLPVRDPRPVQPTTRELQQLGIEVLSGVVEAMPVLEERAQLYDAIIVSRPHNADYLHAIRRYNPEAVVIYDAEAIFALRDVLQAEIETTDPLLPPQFSSAAVLLAVDGEPAAASPAPPSLAARAPARPPASPTDAGTPSLPHPWEAGGASAGVPGGRLPGGATRRRPLTPQEAEARIRAEIALVEAADLVITVSERERRVVNEFRPEVPVLVWGHSVATREPTPGFDARRDILFVGNLGSPPNMDAVLYLVQRVFPLVRERLDCRLLLVGRTPPVELRQAVAGQPGVELLTDVRDLAPVYDASRVFVAPTRFAAGIPLKVVEAMANGVPCVVSPLLADQLGLSPDPPAADPPAHPPAVSRATARVATARAATAQLAALIGADPAAFAERIVRLHEDRTLWEQVQAAAYALVRRDFDAAVARQRLQRYLADAFAHKEIPAPTTASPPAACPPPASST